MLTEHDARTMTGSDAIRTRGRIAFVALVLGTTLVVAARRRPRS